PLAHDHQRRLRHSIPTGSPARWARLQVTVHGLAVQVPHNGPQLCSALFMNPHSDRVCMPGRASGNATKVGCLTRESGYETGKHSQSLIIARDLTLIGSGTQLPVDCALGLA
ncbi:MAG: hypothetical protein OXC07_07070, partial [Kistimonas sp.]|nr:hypothetical protein [Kistimonas sp.]